MNKVRITIINKKALHVDLTTSLNLAIMKKSLLLLIFPACLIISSTITNAQTRLGRTYRVTAYKKGDLTIQSVSNETVIIPNMTIYVPNTFTPNDDGINDTFGVNGEAIKEFNMAIYDRWGQLLFESNDKNKRWDGSYKGKKVATGAYVYVINAAGITGLRQTREGQVNIIM